MYILSNLRPLERYKPHQFSETSPQDKKVTNKLIKLVAFPFKHP